MINEIDLTCNETLNQSPIDLYCYESFNVNLFDNPKPAKPKKPILKIPSFRLSSLNKWLCSTYKSSLSIVRTCDCHKHRCYACQTTLYSLQVYEELFDWMVWVNTKPTFKITKIPKKSLK